MSPLDASEQTVSRAELGRFNAGVALARQEYEQHPTVCSRFLIKPCIKCGRAFGNRSYRTCAPCRKEVKEQGEQS